MNERELEDFLATALENRLGTARGTILDAPNLFRIGLDSSGFVELVGEIERKFSIRFSNEDLMSPLMTHYRGIARLIREKTERYTTP